MIPTPWQKELEAVQKSEEWINAYLSRQGEHKDHFVKFSYYIDGAWRPAPEGLARELSSLANIQSIDLLNAAIDNLREKLKEAKIQAKEDLTAMLVKACTE